MFFRKKNSLITSQNLTKSFELELGNATKRVRLFVVIFSTMIRREFYAAPTVFQFWKEHQLPLLTHAVDHLKLLAYAVEVVVPEDLRQSKDKYVISDPRMNSQADRRLKSIGCHLPFVKIIDRAMLAIVEVFDQNDFQNSTGVSAEVSDCLRQVQLRINELCIAIDSWIEVLNEHVPKGATDLFPVKLKYSEIRRRNARDVVRTAFRSIRSNADILTICLNTRAATLAFFYEIAVASNQDELSHSALTSRVKELIELHREALASCDEVSNKDNDYLLQLAKHSISWRCDELLPQVLHSLPQLLKKQLHPEKHEVLEADFLVDPAWLRGSKPLTIQAPLSAEKLGVSNNTIRSYRFYRADSQEFRLIRSRLNHDDFAVRIVPAKCQMETANWDEHRKQLTIQVSASRGVDQLFLLVSQLLWAKLANSIKYEDLTERLHTELDRYRLVFVAEYVHTKLRYSSCLSLQLGQLDMLRELERMAMLLATYSDDMLRLSSSIDSYKHLSQPKLEVGEDSPEAILLKYWDNDLRKSTEQVSYRDASPFSAVWPKSELKRRILDHSLTRQTVIQCMDALRGIKPA